MIRSTRATTLSVVVADDNSQRRLSEPRTRPVGIRCTGVCYLLSSCRSIALVGPSFLFENRRKFKDGQVIAEHTGHEQIAHRTRPALRTAFKPSRRRYNMHLRYLTLA